MRLIWVLPHKQKLVGFCSLSSPWERARMACSGKCPDTPSWLDSCFSWISWTRLLIFIELKVSEMEDSCSKRKIWLYRKIMPKTAPWVSVHGFSHRQKCAFLTAYGGSRTTRRLSFPVQFSRLLLMENKNMSSVLKPGYETFKNTQRKIFIPAELNIRNLYLLEQQNILISKTPSLNC